MLSWVKCFIILVRVPSSCNASDVMTHKQHFYKYFPRSSGSNGVMMVCMMMMMCVCVGDERSPGPFSSCCPGTQRAKAVMRQ